MDDFFPGLMIGTLCGVFVCLVIFGARASNNRDGELMTAMQRYDDCVFEQYGMTVYAYRENNDNKMPVCNFNKN